jgi:predicted phosphodiesterase
MQRIISGDWHVMDGRPAEPCDRQLVRRLVTRAIERRVSEVILNGDIIDLTRGGTGVIPEAAAFLADAVLRMLSPFGIYVSYVFGNHDWRGLESAKVCQALYQAGADPAFYRCSTGPEFRGPFVIEHGHRFDPWCRGGALARIGEVATRVDGLVDQTGLELQALDPTDWHPGQRVPALDLPAAQQANRWAALFGQHLVYGHTHAEGDVSGRHGGRPWRVLNPGALTVGNPGHYVLIDDESGEGRVEAL